MFVGLTALTFALLSLVARAQDENVTVVSQTLQAEKIIPAVLPQNATIRFALEVVFPDGNATLAVTAGANLTIPQVAKLPLFSLQSNNTAIIGKPYLMVLLDLGATTPDNTTQSPVLHLLLADQTADNITNGEEFVLLNKSTTADLANYVPPAPANTSAPHLYAVLCYLQSQAGITPPSGFNPDNRNNFNINSFLSSVTTTQNVSFTFISATSFFVGANLTGSLTPNATLPDGALPSTTAPGNGSSSGSGSGSSGNTSGAFGDNNTLLKAIAWSVVGVLTATGALLV